MVASQVNVMGLQPGDVVIALIPKLWDNRVHWTLWSKNLV